MASEAGRKGEAVRSDCWVSLELGAETRIQLKSKLETLYGDNIRAQAARVLDALGVKGTLLIEDSGALPWVIAARIEAAARRAGVKPRALALPEAPATPPPPSTRERLRRSRLYLPGNEPKFMINAGLHGPDGVILDLEDSVAPAEKDAARVLVRNALLAIDFVAAERQVRVNQGALGLEDVDAVVPAGVDLILIPKVESADQVKAVAERVATHRPARPVYLMPIIESALGCFRALEIATAAPSVVALTIGLEDYTADIGAQRTLEAKESFWARAQVVNAARAAGVQAIDTVFSDVADSVGLRKSVEEAKGLGFEGKGCIHPRQIAVIHDAFAPDAKAVERATAIVRAFEDAERRGLAVVSLGSKMIDPPVVKRALHTVKLAERTGRLAPDWRAQKPAEKKA